MKRLTVALLLAGFASVMLAGAAPKKIVLIAGPLDDHGPGTHEYENNVLVLKHCLDNARNVSPMQTDVHFNGWPTNAAALDDADTIVLTSGGSDRNETDHPLYVGDRFAQLDKQMKRGCGVVMIHWSVFHPSRNHDKVTEWLGGYFDYETGTGGPTKKWFSEIQHAKWPVIPGAPDHPVLRGVKPFELQDEFYFNMRFRENDQRLVPLLHKEEAKPSNVIAWAVERQDGGRGFGFTCGHFYTNWWQPEFRKTVLNAIVWTAKGDVPAGGISSSLETFQSPPSRRGNPQAPIPWAEPSKARKVKPPTKALDDGKTSREEAWKDSRWNQMDIGQFLASTIAIEKATVAKGLSIRVGRSNEAAVVYDTASCNLRAAWTGNFLQFDPTRFGLINTPAIAGQIQYVPPALGWSGAPQFHGLHRNGKRVALAYQIEGRKVLESPWFESGVFTRSFQIVKTKGSKNSEPLILKLAEVRGSTATITNLNGPALAIVTDGDNYIAAAVAGHPAATLRAFGPTISLHIESRDETISTKVLLWSGPKTDLKKFAAYAVNHSGPETIADFQKPGPPQWGEALAVKGEIALPSNEPYVVDTITVPYENPFKALMFLSGVDFFSNGDAAACSIHGDVWIVSGIDNKLQTVKWKRFATGLFQPLGLKIVNNKVHVLGRDQVTVLHDQNNDGEADFYENFCNKIKTSPGGHDYVTSLETDAEGNFYYVCPEGVHRISKDGKTHETIATGFRNPNGMGIGPGGIITVAPQEGTWTPSSAIFEIKKGGFYGYGGPQITSERPLGYDAPLCWIPRMIDNSTGSQVWAPEKFGPLSGQMLSLSFGRCSMMLVLREVIDGQAQGGVVALKPKFLSGAMRGTFRKQDAHLYVVGSHGWSTSATRDGCFQRVRYTGKKTYLPTGLNVLTNGIKLTFSEPLEAETAEDIGSYGVEQWNYRYSKEYGSKEYSVLSPDEVGHDPLDIRAAKLSADGRSVFLDIPGLQPVMQMQIEYNINAADGKTVRGEIYNTINRLGAAN